MDQAESSPSPGQPEPGQPARQGQPAPRPDRHAEREVPALRLEHPVLAGYDGSASSRNALAYAAGLSRRLGRPLLIGTSRKWTIGAVLGGAPAGERLFGTAATVALSVAGGADIVRVHDVAAMKQVVLVADSVSRGWPSGDG